MQELSCKNDLDTFCTIWKKLGNFLFCNLVTLIAIASFFLYFFQGTKLQITFAIVYKCQNFDALLWASRWVREIDLGLF